MAARFLYILPVLIAAPLLVHGGPWCFKCDGNAHPAVCQAVIVCGDHENCYADKHLNNNGVLQYTSGCKPVADCVKTVRKRSTSATQCSECCTGTACNAKVCGAQDLSVSGARLWCVECGNQQNPSDCDQVTLCSQDEQCSVTKQSIFGMDTYSMGCEKKTVCQGKTLATDNFQCCSDNLCNTNTALVSPDQYTPPPPTTTTPPPSAASAKLNETSVDFVSQHLSNETIELFCELTGFPYPNVTWSFFPDANVTSGNATSGSGNATTASVSATTTTTPSTPVCTCPTVASNGTLAGTTPFAGVTTTPTPGANSSTAAANTGPAGTPITTGVTTTSNMSTLVITSPSASTAGTYVCSADNGNGPQESTAHVSYSAAPKIAGAANETTQGNARDDVLLECDVDGSPAPKIDWTVPPNAGGVEKLANGSLLIHNAHGDNSGEYKCLANNTAGTAEKDFTVTITDNSATTCPTAATTTVATTVPPTTATPATCPPPVTCPVATCPTCPPPATCPVVTCPTTLASLITTAALCPTTPTTAATTTTPTPTAPTTPAPYALTTQGPLWRDTDAGPHMLHCEPPPGSHDPVVWKRMEQDFNRTATTVFNETPHGMLTITKPGTATATNVMGLTGVYQCSLATRPDVTREYVLYKTIPGPADCRMDFAMGQTNPGIVFQTTCGPCQLPVTTNTNLFWRDFVCASAVSRGLIQAQTGGTVTWLLQNNNEVSLLQEQNGHVVLVP